MGDDCTELNHDMIHLISKKLENFSNLIRLRLVCKQWRLAANPANLPQFPSIPCLWQPTETLYSNETNTKIHDYQVFSLASLTSSLINLPITHKEFKFNYDCHKVSCLGFLLVKSYTLPKPLFLFNPLTETKIHLPFPKGCYHSTFYMGPNSNSNSRTNKGLQLMLLALDYCEIETTKYIMVWQSNNDKITTCRIPLGLGSGPALPVYYKGKLFVIYSHRTRQETVVFDIKTGSEMNIVIPNPREHRTFQFLVESMGDLLGVVFYYADGAYKFKVYRLEHTDDFEQCRWIKLKDIGDRVLFLNSKNQGFCLSTNDFTGLRGNCIYFFGLYVENGPYQHPVFRYHMEDGTTVKLWDHASLDAIWFVPSLSLAPDWVSCLT